MVQKLLVVGGNGFLGSSVCKQAISKGWEVTSISSSGRPFKTPRGHTPAWVSKVDWHAASAFDPPSYSHFLGESTAVVHTLGTLFENTAYKSVVRSNAIRSLFGTFFGGLTKSNSNPLKKNDPHGLSSYQSLNHDSALLVLDAYRAALSSSENSSSPTRRTFVYISAEDISRPLVPRGYIDTKRAAERDIALACASDSPPLVRGISIRPGLMYHPHMRPLTTPIATLLSLSSDVQHYVTSKSRGVIPTPSSILRSIPFPFSSPSHGSELTLPSPLESIANALEIPPLHVDQVAKAILLAITDVDAQDGEGGRPGLVLGVREMKKILAWDTAEETGAGTGTVS